MVLAAPLLGGFPGTELLIWIGLAMVFYAILENDMRRILAYSIVNQVGFLVRGIALRNHPPMRAM